MTRSLQERTRDARHRLEHDVDVWFATASLDGLPHLVPFALGWHDGQVLTATPTSSPTVKNITASGRARLALDSTRDVVVIVADAEAHSAERGRRALDTCLIGSGVDEETCDA